MSRLAVCSNADVDGHDTGPHHPERPSRLRAALAGIADLDADGAVVTLEAPEAGRVDLERVHDGDYLDALESLCGRGGGEIDADTRVSAGSWDTAVRSAGAGLAAVEALARGEATAGLVLTRPPGHHASRRVAQGFCLLNNVAVVAAQLAAAKQRVVIIDWDVHHGNGTQDIFWDRPEVMYVSTHQAGLYPGTGHPDEIGGYGAMGTNLNVPLPAGATGDVVLAALDEIVTPRVASFRPHWVLISAGFDAHRDDPLADLAMTSGDYRMFTERIMSWAPEPGRTVAFLEGGYDLDALRHCVRAVASTLLGARSNDEDPSSGGPGRQHLQSIARAMVRAEEWI